ncbi:hypothetical protein H8S10_08525 [Clostridium sp. NSJ-49]|jgi:hypothetical protein|uniref:Uncharacterized protein n=1 Tax=Clostridium disporicum TaxID=84024 RepID=A0A174CB96_9CLOT|nr:MULTISPECIES: hypothetical protein [Clostridium]MBC5625494.1 hypothetical protein [Clostridium sp. NSJ-49]MCD2501369.1 hypothetical protein [Clostridium sp. NSJ-145]CUO10752.1 Uncharacterised protein [Clostridium disporicum]
MYISMPRDFFVPVMYDYKENLGLLDKRTTEMNRESTGEEKVNQEYYKALQNKEATYIKPGSKETNGQEVDEEYYKALQEKEATYVEATMYNSIDDEYINSATNNKDKYINKGETKENYKGSNSRSVYSDIDDEYARGFKR